jgi:HK97 family phage major capsid protein
MLTKTEYQNRIGQLLDKVSAFDDKATVENRDLTISELSLKNEALDQVQEYKHIVDTMERQERLQAALAKPGEPMSQPRAARDVQVGAPNASKEKFNSFGQQLHAVMKAGLPGGNVDPRLFNATGLNETVPSDGGFLVQTDFSSKMLQDVFQTGILASRCQRVTISGNSNGTKMNGVDETSRATGSRFGGIRGYWAGEADEKTKSKPKFRQIELNLKKLVGLCYATDEMLDDAAQLEGVIRNGFVSEFGFLLDDAIVNGTGLGQPLGILNSGALVTQTAESGQGNNTVIGKNVIKMWSRLFPSSKANAAWFINQEVEPQLQQMSLGDGTSFGQLVYTPPGGLSGAPYGTLFGRPVIPIEQCQALGTAGDIILADLSNGYILAEKGGIKSDMSIHVRFVYDESVFRFVMRVDGQPVRATTLTPYKGSATLSHFVALHSTRS